MSILLKDYLVKNFDECTEVGKVGKQKVFAGQKGNNSYVDIREVYMDDDQQECAGRGIRLKTEDAKNLLSLLEEAVRLNGKVTDSQSAATVESIQGGRSKKRKS